MKNKLIIILFQFAVLSLLFCGCRDSNDLTQNMQMKQEIIRINDYYSKDKKNIYYFDQIFNLADPDTFLIISKEYGWYAKDMSNVYYYNEKIPDADLNSFTIVNDNYAIDKNNVYFTGNIVNGIKVDEFQIISQNYHLAKDTKHIYFQNNVIHNSDPETFVILNSWFWKDKNNVYFFSLSFYPDILGEADAKTFEVINGEKEPMAQDRYRKYYVSELIREHDSGSH